MIARFYQVLQHLSIDIVLGAVILLHFFSAPFKVSLDWSVYVLLASSVWIIYTVDHLRDAKRGKSSGRARYVFHANHRSVLKIMVGIVTFLSAILIFRLPREVLVGGSVLVPFCLLYIFLQARLARWGAKEAYVAFIYTAGILIAPVTLTQSFDPFLFTILFALAFSNLIIFSWFEVGEDQNDGFSSIATVSGSAKLEKYILVILALGLACAFSGILSLPREAIYVIVALSIYAGLIVYKERTVVQKYYRAIGDGVFLLPILLQWL